MSFWRIHKIEREENQFSIVVEPTSPTTKIGVVEDSEILPGHGLAVNVKLETEECHSAAVEMGLSIIKTYEEKKPSPQQITKNLYLNITLDEESKELLRRIFSLNTANPAEFNNTPCVEYEFVQETELEPQNDEEE